MEWNNDEQEILKKGMTLSSKILLTIIICIILIIILLIMLLLSGSTQGTFYEIYVNEQSAGVSADTLLTKIDDITYVNIEEFSKLVGYEYHKGEYKAYTIEEDKCYVKGTDEITSFYLNDNTIYKLLTDNLDAEYSKNTVEYPIKSQDNKMYAPIDAISKAFNVVLNEASNYFAIYTLDYLVTINDTNVMGWGYESIAEQSFQNKKAILYGFLIVRKTDGLYKIIDGANTKEIVSDKYTSIEFLEETQEFMVKDSSGKVGTIDFEGKMRLELNYDSISVLDKTEELYIIKQNAKYGVVKSDNRVIIFPEYDGIGLTDGTTVILDRLIPVYKGDKWGAYDKEGKLVLSVEYDGFGYNLTSIEIKGVKEVVEPVLSIERCNGVVVKKLNKYGLMDITGEELVPIEVDGIYAVKGEEDEDSKYYMLYNEEEMNVIDRLIIAGKIEKNEDKTGEEIENTTGNIVNEMVTEGNNTTNEVSSTIENENILNDEV